MRESLALRASKQPSFKVRSPRLAGLLLYIVLRDICNNSYVGCKNLIRLPETVIMDSSLWADLSDILAYHLQRSQLLFRVVRHSSHLYYYQSYRRWQPRNRICSVLDVVVAAQVRMLHLP